MEFQGIGRPFDQTGMESCCDALGVSAAEMWAVLTVETRGFGFLPDRRPQILFERHIFHRLTGGRFDAVRPDLSSATQGGYSGGASEYGRLGAAIGLDRQAALGSASWGIGQVMGCNYATAGFASTEEMVAAMVKDENSQLQATAAFIRKANLDDALRARDWAAFARGYNGKDFKKNDYDTRLAAAHAKCLVALPDLRLRTVQASLLYLGLDPGAIDGLWGRRTRSALTTFQSGHSLPATGELDDSTESRLVAEAFPVPSASSD